ELMISIQERSIKWVRIFTDACADVNVIDDYGNTALTYISKSNPKHSEIYSLLTILGAKDDNYKKLKSLNRNATDDQQRESTTQIDAMKAKWKLNISYQARQSLYQTCVSNSRQYTYTMKCLINDGILPSEQTNFILFKDPDDISEISAIIEQLHNCHKVETKRKEQKSYNEHLNEVVRAKEKEVNEEQKERNEVQEKKTVHSKLNKLQEDQGGLQQMQVELKKTSEKLEMQNEDQLQRSLNNDTERNSSELTQQPLKSATRKTSKRLKPCHHNLLQRIPVVQFYGMGDDGSYIIQIVEGCVNKTSAFIKQQIPGYRFKFVPWKSNESYGPQLLGCAGGPLHSRERISDGDPNDEVKVD
ncbi:unnamed protein product, partial [Owenia fusiformis]